MRRIVACACAKLRTSTWNIETFNWNMKFNDALIKGSAGRSRAETRKGKEKIGERLTCARSTVFMSVMQENSQGISFLMSTVIMCGGLVRGAQLVFFVMTFFTWNLRRSMTNPRRSRCVMALC